MARSNKSLVEELMDLLLAAPWWWSPLAAVLGYVFVGAAVPVLMPSDNLMLSSFGEQLSKLAPYVAALLLLPAPIAYLNGRRKSKQLDVQTGLDSIRGLNWKQFEELMAEAYSRKGYLVRENHKAGADGGVDIWLEKDGDTRIVQCKHWRSQKVGVSIIREMYGVMVDSGASSVSVVSSGDFTAEAQRFAKGKPIELVAGPGVAQLIGDVRNAPHTPKNESAPDSTYGKQSDLLTCPQCGGALVKRTAKRGEKAGQQFLGCSRFPRCRYTVDLP